MNDENEILRAALRSVQNEADGSAPDFKTIFSAAQRRFRNRRKKQFTGLAAAAAVAVLAVSMLPKQQDEFSYVDVEELMSTTQWSAPSDSLIPQRRIDVYRDLPRLLEWTDASSDMSMDTDEGA